MANALPILRSTTGGLNAQVLYPFTRTVRCSTQVQVHWNGSEQRFVAAPPFTLFSLPMSMLLTADQSAWLQFFVTQKGRFNGAYSGSGGPASPLSLTLGSTVYDNLVLMSDDFSSTSRLPLLYDQQINLRQVANYPYTVPSVGNSYPLLNFGSAAALVSSELPFVQTSMFLSSVNESSAGPRYARAWYGAGLKNFPGAGSGATATATISGGSITAVTPVNAGHGYVSAPEIQITGDGKGAAAIAIIQSGGLATTVMINGGSGYTVATVTVISNPYLRSWGITYPLLTDVDAGTIENYFRGQQGRYGTFAFVDPIDGIAYPNVRFDQDELQLRSITVNQNSTRVTLRQTF